ncbi:dihydroxy-acid dehydratase, partial [Rhizobium ruizarguesonis]
DKGGLLNRDCPTVHAETLGDAIDRWDITRTNSETVRNFYRAAPGGIPTQVAFSQEARWDDLDTDRENGVIRSVEHPFS